MGGVEVIRRLRGEFAICEVVLGGVEGGVRGGVIASVEAIVFAGVGGRELEVSLEVDEVVDLHVTVELLEKRVLS